MPKKDQKHIVIELDEDEKSTLDSIRISRVVLPILLGIIVVVYLLYKQFDPKAFKDISWSSDMLMWIIMGVILLIVRHLAYSTRLKILSEGVFSWNKCIELIFIWEFSSAISPTSVGGSAVALFALSQEKIGPAKTATIVLYTVVVDTLFFISTIPILFFFFGPEMIRPDLTYAGELGGWFFTFIAAYVFMFIYGLFFFFGLFINPEKLKKIILTITYIPFLKKYRDRLDQIGTDFIIASKEIKKRTWKFHLGVFVSTAIAWSMRFLLLNCLIIGFVPETSVLFAAQTELFARIEAMFVIMAFSPTPGGAGFAEIVFGGFLKDYVPVGIALVIAFLWRLMTYYSYLIAGVIIVPNWIRKVMNRKRKKRNKLDKSTK